jgi:hypothetical protein
MPKYFTLIFNDAERGKSLIRARAGVNGKFVQLTPMGFHVVFIDYFVYRDTDYYKREYVTFIDIKGNELKEFEDDETALLWFKLNH